MDIRLTFDEDAANYDALRPTYCADLFRDVLAYSGLAPGMHAVEVGIGTGQATRPFLDAGCRVTAVELGANLADYVRRKFAAYPLFRVENVAFEAFECPPESVDLLYSATAFHWIPEDTGYPKALRLLRRGGTLALFWNRPAPRGDDPLHVETQNLYRKYPLGDTYIPPPAVDDPARYRRIRDTIASFGFDPVEFRLYHAVRTFNATDYVRLLNTYSDHRSRPAAVKEAFEREQADLIRSYGDRFEIHDTMDLYLARKP